MTFESMQIIAALCGALFFCGRALFEDRAIGMALCTILSILHCALAVAVAYNL